MAIIAPRVYFDNSNYRDPLGAIIAGANEETERRENLKDQRTKRAVAKQLAALDANKERLAEIEAGFGGNADTYGGGPRMGGSAETGSTQGQHLDVPEGLANQLAAIRSQVGTSLQTGHTEDGVFIPGPLGPRTGPSDAERELAQRHGYAMEEDAANNAERREIAQMGDTAAMDRLTKQLQSATDRTMYEQGQETERNAADIAARLKIAGMAHGDTEKAARSERIAALRVEQQNAHSLTQTAASRLAQFKGADLLRDPGTPPSSEEQQAIDDYQKALDNERAVSDALARETGVATATPIASPTGQPVIRGGIPAGAEQPAARQAPRASAVPSPVAAPLAVNEQAAADAFRAANAKAARARALGAPESEVRAALAAEIAQIAKQYGLAPSGGR